MYSYGWFQYEVYFNLKIEKLNLINFRNYDVLDISFCNNLNIIIGNNAQGKTNILDAIYYLSITKSNFSTDDKVCIKKNKMFSKIVGLVSDNDKKNKLSILINNKEKKLELNDNVIKKHSSFVGKLKVIFFEPNNLKILKDNPSNRRRFLNIEISQIFSNYINILNEYNIILKQRNEYLKYLKNNSVNEIYFDIINSKLVDLSFEICNYRLKFINAINEYIGNIYYKLADLDGLVIKYVPSVDFSDITSFKEDMKKRLDDVFEKEVLYGSTLIGPHRDDFTFVLNADDLLLYGSQGQQKMAVLALRIAEIDVFKDLCGVEPVLLLDDLFSELDIEKRNNVLKYLNRDIQIIITTTDLKNINTKYVKKSVVYKIDNGSVVE